MLVHKNTIVARQDELKGGVLKLGLEQNLSPEASSYYDRLADVVIDPSSPLRLRGTCALSKSDQVLDWPWLRGSGHIWPLYICSHRRDFGRGDFLVVARHWGGYQIFTAFRLGHPETNLKPLIGPFRVDHSAKK